MEVRGIYRSQNKKTHFLFGKKATLYLSATDNLSGVAWTTPAVTITQDGVRQIEYYSIDNAGNIEEKKTITVKVDTTPPDLEISAAPDILWPPNHKLVDVTVNGSASDDLSGMESISFEVIDEYDECEPEINNFGDVIRLIAWREGNDRDGRTYTIRVTVVDVAGNTSAAQTQVIVPHDQKGKNK